MLYSANSTSVALALAGALSVSLLATAFFYAGVKALLVSHWYVDSNAAVQLTTRTMATMAADQSIGRSEALRRAMAAMLTTPAIAHPSYSAPFAVVGEGDR